MTKQQNFNYSILDRYILSKTKLNNQHLKELQLIDEIYLRDINFKYLYFKIMFNTVFENIRQWLQISKSNFETYFNSNQYNKILLTLNQISNSQINIMMLLQQQLFETGNFNNVISNTQKSSFNLFNIKYRDEETIINQLLHITPIEKFTTEYQNNNQLNWFKEHKEIISINKINDDLFKLVIKDKFCKYNSTMYSIIHYLIKIITDERYKESLNKFKQITLLDKSINSLFDTNETFEIKLQKQIINKKLTISKYNTIFTMVEKYFLQLINDGYQTDRVYVKKVMSIFKLLFVSLQPKSINMFIQELLNSTSNNKLVLDGIIGSITFSKLLEKILN